jgi:hypothetical protein
MIWILSRFTLWNPDFSPLLKAVIPLLTFGP